MISEIIKHICSPIRMMSSMVRRMLYRLCDGLVLVVPATTLQEQRSKRKWRQRQRQR